MKDRLTKKRIKVDYEAIIVLLGLTYEFTAYLFTKNQKISIRRSALAFLRSKRVNIEWCHLLMKTEGITSFSELLSYAGSIQAIEEYAYEL